ncbi:retrovirus-related pol polyprotein from transposon TNT 1-94 [Tanacetum coccineum]
MTTLAEFMIIVGPMLENSLYDSWKSHTEFSRENKENGRMILDSVQNGPLVWPTVVHEDGTTRKKTYAKLSATKKLQADCDCKATNIVLQGLPPDVYAIVNHHKVSKELWDRVKLLMQGTKLSLQEKEFQVNTKFLNSLPPEWSKFVTDFPQSYSPIYPPPYPSQPQINHSSVPPSQQYQSHMDHKTSYVPQIAYHSPQASTQPMTEIPQMDLGLAVPVFTQGDDPIACLNKATAFLTAVASSRGNNTSRQARVVKCYNCQGEGHMARQCTQPKRPRNVAWFKDKAMLAKAQEARQILDEEQLAFLADPGIPDSQAVQTTISNNVAFQTKDLDAYDSDCDDVSNAKAVLMANLSNYGSDVISDVLHSDSYHNDMDNQSVHAKQDFEQHHSREKMIDSQMDDMIKEKLTLKEQVDSLEQNLSKQIKEKESLLQTFTVFKNEFREKENKYMANEIDLENKIKELDNIVYKVGQSAQTVHIYILQLVSEP